MAINQVGITPACAGNSVPHQPVDVPKWDHPRLRGEQKMRPTEKEKEEGSPPLARGTGGTNTKIKSFRGITPACAGNSYL